MIPKKLGPQENQELSLRAKELIQTLKDELPDEVTEENGRVTITAASLEQALKFLFFLPEGKVVNRK